ncbi:MAG: THUMP domain-containing protein [Bacteroidota bacterium]
MKFIAKTIHGLEEILAKELQYLGASQVQTLRRAVSFEGDQRLLYRANYELRTALSILQPIHHFKAQNEEAFYRGIYRFDWFPYLDVKTTFAIHTTVHSNIFKHSQYIGLKTKDAIVDQFRKRLGKRPSISRDRPDVRINVHINRDQCTLSLDSSGEPLYKRGYRATTVEAPINEVLAAGMIQIAGWQADRPFIDPFCGSGTLLIEAAMYAYQMPAMLNRADFGFKRWRDFDPPLWKEVIDQAAQKQLTEGPLIQGSDKDFRALRATENNLLAAGLEGKVEVQRLRFEKKIPPPPPGLLMSNPPYDERLKDKDIEALYKGIGDQLKQHYAGYEAWLISSNMEAIKRIGLRPSKKYQLFNGALPCKLLKYELYAGSKKQKHQSTE